MREKKFPVKLKLLPELFQAFTELSEVNGVTLQKLVKHVQENLCGNSTKQPISRRHLAAKVIRTLKNGCKMKLFEENCGRYRLSKKIVPDISSIEPILCCRCKKYAKIVGDCYKRTTSDNNLTQTGWSSFFNSITSLFKLSSRWLSSKKTRKKRGPSSKFLKNKEYQMQLRRIYKFLQEYNNNSSQMNESYDICKKCGRRKISKPNVVVSSSSNNSINSIEPDVEMSKTNVTVTPTDGEPKLNNCDEITNKVYPELSETPPEIAS